MEAVIEYNFSNEELVRLYKATKDNYYVSILFEANYKIIYKLSKKYSKINWMFSIDDLFQESYIALEKSIQFYVEGASSFYSFFSVVLNQHLHSVVNGITSKDKANKKLNECVSIYQALSDEDDLLLLDQIEDSISSEEMFNLPEVLFMADLHAIEEKALNKLTNKQKAVVEGINGFNSAVYSVNELSELLNVSYPRITELRNNSYLKLRQDPNLRKIWETEFLYR